MDPDKALQDIRDGLEEWHSAISDSEEESEANTKIRDAIEALDKWITEGGFLPKDWQEV